MQSSITSDVLPLPCIVDAGADADFREVAKALSLDPDKRWIGGYVDYEWQHLRHVIDIYVGDIAGQDILEFGCNIGGSAVVMALLGGKVTAIDIDRDMTRLAEANLRRYGFGDKVRVCNITDTRQLPFEDGSFDVVTCNSVLEYVAPDHLAAVLAEIDRVLRPGGILLILGTSNRLWPREIHSGSWCLNWLPRFLDRFLSPGEIRQRGVFPWDLRRSLRGYAPMNISGEKYLELQHRFGASPIWRMGVRIFVALATLMGVSPTLLTPNILMVLRKP